VDLVDKGEGSITMGYVTQLLKGADSSGHRMDGLKSHNLKIYFPKKL
jgi:hypothetical protein